MGVCDRCLGRSVLRHPQRLLGPLAQVNTHRNETGLHDGDCSKGWAEWPASRGTSVHNCAQQARRAQGAQHGFAERVIQVKHGLTVDTAERAALAALLAGGGAQPNCVD